MNPTTKRQISGLLAVSFMNSALTEELSGTHRKHFSKIKLFQV
jgi:hypothetical protein